MGIRREASAFALSSACIAHFELPTFSRRLQQHCKMLSADFSRLIVLTVYGLVPFIFSFHDLRLSRNEGVAQYTEHLIVINTVFAIVSFVPRLKIPSGVEVHQFG